MSRLMSVAFTEQAVVERRKTVTRRKGWWENKNGRRLLLPGDRLTLCRKVMGRKAGEPLVRVAEVEVVDVRREPLHFVQYDGELTKEGFPDLEPTRILDGTGIFIKRYFEPQGIGPSDLVTRIEWRYLGCDRVNCAGRIILAWGAHPEPERAWHVATMVEGAGRKPLCLGTTKHGQPRHPLMLASATPLRPWSVSS